MKTSTAIVAALAAFAASGACAQTAPLSYTDAGPHTDFNRVFGRAPTYWKGQLTRADVLAALRQARMEGTVATGDAIDYPYRGAQDTQAQVPAQGSPAQALGGPPGDGLTLDGYRFVGGEMGYVYVGRKGPAQ